VARGRIDFTWAGFRSGVAGAGAVAASTFVFGIAFGALAGQKGLSLVATLLMSGVVYAGSAQIVALQVWSTPVPVVAVWVATLAINARYILMSAALRPWFARLRLLPAYGSLFVLADANWALAMGERAAGRDDAAYLLGGGVVMYVSWMVASGLGYGLGQVVGAPRRFGLDFMVAAFCTTTAVAVWRGRRDVWPLAAAAIVAIAVDRIAPGHSNLLAGAVAGSLVGAWRDGAPA
jgi:predicted branched-subunit amino acid permease